MDGLDTALETLKSEPSTESLETLLQSFTTDEVKNYSDDLRIVSAILDFTIPETYEILPQKTSKTIDYLLMTRIGLSQLVKRVESDQNEVFAIVLVNIVSDINLVPRLFNSLSHQKIPKLVFKEMKGLLIHKVLEVLNKRYLQNKNDFLATITYPSTYYKTISNSVIKSFEKIQDEIQKTYLAELIIGIISKENNHLLGLFFNDEYCNIQLSNLFNGNDIFGSLILIYLKDNLCERNIGPYATILKDLNVNYSSLVTLAVDVNCPELLKLTIHLCNKTDPKLKRYLQECIIKFGSKSYINTTPLRLQEDFTKCIMILIYFVDDDNLVSDPSFLRSISNRLESTTHKIRSLGMSVAETCYQKSNSSSKKFMFDIDDQIEAREKLLQQIGEPISEDLTKKQAIGYDKSISKATEVIALPALSKPLPIGKPAIEYIESDSEDSDDDDASTSRKSKVPIPVYLNELLRYIQTESSDKLCFEKQSMAFKVSAQLIRHKSGSEELKFYGSALLENVLGSSNKFNFAEFESWKLSVLIAITSGDFDNSSEKLVKLFISGDYSLAQRLMILSCLGLTCRELSGYSDDFVKGKEKVANVGSRLLPTGIHEQFIAYEVQNNSKQIEKVNEVSELLDNIAISDGKVVRKSANLQKMQSKTGRSTKDLRFFGKIGKLYFSLVSTWFTAGQINNKNGFNIGQFSPVLNGHFIKTLALLLECAIPLSYNHTEMVDEFFTISIESVRDFLTKRDALILEAVLIGLNVILDKMDHALIGRLNLEQLIPLNECLILICNEVPLANEGVLNRCVTVARQISDIVSRLT